VDSAETACEGTVSAEMRCSCAACHTLHDAARDRQWPEHSEQRPRESGTWVASRARHPWVRRGNSLRATEIREPLSALLASSSSMSSRSHTACRRIWPRTWSTSATPPFRARLAPVCLRPSGLCPGEADRYSRVPRTSVPISRHSHNGKWRPNKVGRAQGWIEPAIGCLALIGRAMTVSGTY
jgi:hypothetical protein